MLFLGHQSPVNDVLAVVVCFAIFDYLSYHDDLCMML